MKTYYLSVLCVALVATLAMKVEAIGEQTRQKPNIVFFLADDLGYGDVACYGHPSAKTPNLDRLAREGVRFTQHYANGPECTPTRTALLTGQYQQRQRGLECAIGTGNVGRYDEAIRLAERRSLGLPATASILPAALKQAGYACGMFGKWHLGYEPEFNPMEHQWDSFFGYLGGNVHYFNHRELSDLHVLFRGRLPIYRDGYMTHLITADAIGFVKNHQQQPFFLYVAHECPHFPFQGPGDQQKIVTAENWTEPDRESYVAMLEDLDRQIGRVLRAIDDAGLAGRTIVVFASDNGGLRSVAHLADLRGAKGTTFEGGIRVPLIMRWPGQLPAGQTCNQVSATFDLSASFLSLANADVSTESLDGYDIVKHLVEARPDFQRTLYWRGKRGDRTWSALREGDLKYVRKQEGPEVEQWLFDLASDRGEQVDLLADQPMTSNRLRGKLHAWEDAVRP